MFRNKKKLPIAIPPNAGVGKFPSCGISGSYTIVRFWTLNWCTITTQ